MTTFLQTKMQWLSTAYDHNVVLCTFKDAIEKTEPTKSKAKKDRPIIKRFDHPNYIIKGSDDGRGYTYCDDDYNKLCSFWDGIIAVDLDLKSDTTLSVDKDATRLTTDLLRKLQTISPHNFCYIESSNSLIGKHLLFYFDCDRNFDNYKQCCCYIVETMRQVLKDEYFSNGVFDWSALRATQNIFLTTINCYTINVDGAITFDYDEDKSNENWSNIVKENKDEIHVEGNGIIIETSTCDLETELHYNDRFVVFNTLKNYNIDIDKALEITGKLYDLVGHKSDHNKNEWLRQCKGVYKQSNTLNTKRGISLLSRLGFDLGNTTDDENVDANKIKLEGYISEVKDVETFIYKKLEESTRLSMTAPTGAGKTEFIKGFAKYLLSHNHCVVVLTPQNTTNNLYTNTRRTHHLRKNTPKAKNRNANLIGSKSNNYEFKLDKMNIMLWDQLYKYTDILRESNAVIIVDEAHKIIEDTYRKSAEQAFKILNAHRGMELFITATEIQEMNEALDINHTVEFTKQRRNNTIKFVNAKNDKEAIKLLKGIINIGIKGDAPHIMLCNDNIFNVMQDYCFRCSTIPNIYRSENWSTKMVDNQALDILLKTEKVNETTPISLMTNICFQGINIKNENKMVVVIPFFIGTTSAQQIEQIIGRVRNAEAEIIVVCCWSWNNEAAEMLNEMMTDRDPIYLGVVNAHNKRKTKANAIYDLRKRGFDVLVGPTNAFKLNFDGTKIKMKQSIIGKYERKLYDYIKKQDCDEGESTDIDDLLFKQEYEFAKEKTYKQIVDEAKEKFNDNKYLNAILDDVITWGLCKHFVEYIKYADIGPSAKPHFDKLMKYLIGARQLQSFTVDELEQTIERVETTIKMTKIDGVTEKKANGMKAQMFKQFEKSFVIPAMVVMDGFNGVKKIYDIIVEFSNNKAKGGVKGGVKGSKKVKDTQTGIIYDSCKECANAIGKSNAYISKYKDRFILI